MAIHLTPESNPVVQEGTLYVDSATGEFNVAGRTTPHIIPGVLYPAVSGKLLDGSTSHSGNYGTPQTQTGGDGRSYYYTDIKGSKPIKDPRIGGHFGSQRHTISSLQYLEQETAIEGVDVKSVDGREWMRTRGNWTNINAESSIQIYVGTSETTDSAYIEITGYFNDVNIGLFTNANHDKNIYVDGSAHGSNPFTGGTTSAATPLRARYVPCGSTLNLSLNKTLGIHTLKLSNVNGDFLGSLHYIDLIAQDTTSTANRSKIQIPSQDVVSYGKKFNVSAEGSSGHHYDPFNGFVNGTSLHSAFVDTATSLGLDTAPGNSAKWAISSTNNVRPYNGGRVVKWVDSSGVIKTSVNMMPPNAQNIASSVVGTTEVTTPSATNTTPTPIFSDDAIDHSQSEVAKTFHFREFGNGSANGDSNYPDVSMATSSSDRVYVMDDGLTSYSGDDANVSATHGLWIDKDNANAFITFIGTGVSWDSGANGRNTWAQNLPYGTHVVQYYSGNQQGTAYFAIDGVQVKSDFDNSGNNYVYNWGFGGASGDITFHHPKRPPIPEDACILADFMLMADFVKQSGTGSDIRGQISKGVRRLSGSRDVFCDDTSASSSRAFYDNATDTVHIDVNNPMGLAAFASHASTQTSSAKLDFFGTDVVVNIQASNVAHQCDFGGSTNVNKTALDNTASARGDVYTLDTSATLGINTIKTTLKEGGNRFYGYDLATPIHTSSHYQAFETPYLHELVGGDRNMEQHNLVCSPDGKSWDQLTRDTSYIGNIQLSARVDQGSTTGFLYQDTDVIWDLWRGTNYGLNCGNKDWAIAYNRYICLKAGQYTISAIVLHASGDRTRLRINDTDVVALHETNANDTGHATVTHFFNRGDYISIFDGAYEQLYSHLQIFKV